MRIVLSAILCLLFSGGVWADIAPPYPEFHAGLQIEEGEPFPKVNTIVKGSPAEKAGLKLGDGVIALDGSYGKTRVPFYFWLKGLRGPRGSKLQLVVLRGDSNVLVLTMPRTVSVR